MLTAVIDANVWVSALLTKGKSKDVIDLFKEGRFQLAFAEELVIELEEVLNRPKFQSRITEFQTKMMVELIRSRAKMLELSSIEAISRDPKDDMYLECAKQSGADYLVTGDRDLLILEKHDETKIISPADFVSILKNSL